MLKYNFAFVFFMILVTFNFDIVLNLIRSIAPFTAERIYNFVYLGDTAHRLDFENQQGSAYFIAFKQFLDSPFWGSYFRLITSGAFRGHYPHNLFLEIMITMGIIGLIPLLILLFKVIMNVGRNFTLKVEENQMVCFIIFLKVFLERQTTGSVLLDAQFWVFLYILLIFPLVVPNHYISRVVYRLKGRKF